MTRGRLSDDEETVREMLEGDIGLLAVLIVRTEMVEERLREGVKLAPDLLLPAVQQIQRVQAGCREMQKRLMVRGGSENA